MTTLNDGVAPVQTSNLSKYFGQGDSQVCALDGISLTVQKGEFVAIMGPSGSGKSTLLHLMAGLASADEGHVLVDGQDLAAMGDAAVTRYRRRKIGLVFQAFNLIPSLTAEDNIRLPATERSGLDERVESLLSQLGLTSRRWHKPDALSGGEQQRVAIARALVTDPAIVLADEPTGSVDSTTGQAICKLLRELCDREGRTIVVVTHEPAVASWAGRVIVLQDGRQLTEFHTERTGDPQALAATFMERVREARDGQVAVSAVGGM